MGELIDLASRRAARSAPRAVGGGAPVVAMDAPRPVAVRPVFHFDVGCPFSYLAMERVDALLPHADWRPVDGSALLSRRSPAIALARAAAERRAAQLRTPLIWPERWPEGSLPALRATRFACDGGRGARFALALARLAFCGGFDLDDPEVLAEAAAVAGVPLDGCLAAARDARRDAALTDAALQLADEGAHELPAIRVGVTLFSGERAFASALAAARAQRNGVAG